MALHRIWEPFTLKGLTLRNRIVSTAHSPAYAESSQPRERYQLYHEEKARGGLALTMFGGSSTVSEDSPASFGQISVADDSIIPWFEKFSARIHAHGCALICQISHMGRRTGWDGGDWMTPIAPSAQPEPAHKSFPKVMEPEDFRRVASDFARAAGRCRKGGLDGCEVFVSGHLLGQFWSPAINQRTDAYGGSLDNRLRFTFEVLDEIRRSVGDYLVGLRFSVDEMIRDGLDAAQTVEIALRLATSGLVDYFNLVSSNNWTHAGLSRSVPTMAYGSMPAIDLVSAVRRETGMPVIHACRISDLATAEHALASGFVDLVGMTRAHFADPHLVRKTAENREAEIRPCVGAGYCIDRIYAGRDSLCIHNPATGREQSVPQVIRRTEGRRRKIVVVGAGPAGLEAARIAAERGHGVVVFEAADEVGGQVLLASRAGWRKDLIAIVRWRADRLASLGVTLRMNRYADAQDVRAEDPDVVVIATGGLPNKEFFEGSDLAVSTWDILSGQVKGADDVVVYDDHGHHQGLSAAETIARQARSTRFVTPHRMAGGGLGPTNFAIHLRNLHKAGVSITTDTRLVSVARRGNGLVCTFRHEFDGSELRLETGQIVVECGTLPADELYLALKPQSRNHGIVDLGAFRMNRPQPVGAPGQPGFDLFRIGDAVASRNIHAAMYDAARICKDL
ncbi:MAG: FAD-dependent oxidoreductase [Alphaproteobacteria bacterium]|nr:FAD-dependent oxidoreductase [Alphaproteobacteria bacterium]